MNMNAENTTTLIQLGDKVVFHGRILLMNHREWVLQLENPEIGDTEDLMEYIATLDPTAANKSYIVLESLNDARQIENVTLQQESGLSVLHVVVQDKLPAVHPGRFGTTFKLDDSGDLARDLSLVSGKDAAKQEIGQILGLKKGEWFLAPESGTLISDYYARYYNRLNLLERLIRLELIRLALIPTPPGIGDSKPKRALAFIKRIVDVSISTAKLTGGCLQPLVTLEWGNDEKWIGYIPIFIHVENRVPL